MARVEPGNALPNLIGAGAVLPRTILLTRDHVPIDVADITIANAFNTTTIGLVVAAQNLAAPGFVVALETLRVLLAGMCVVTRVEVRGHEVVAGLQPPFGPGPWLDELAAYRAAASAPITVGPLDDSCRCRIGLGVSDSIDFDFATRLAPARRQTSVT